MAKDKSSENKPNNEESIKVANEAEVEEAEEAKEAEVAEADAHNPDDDELFDVDGINIFDDSNTASNEELEKKLEEAGVDSLKPTRYQKECFLKFGYEDIDSRLQLESLMKYLTLRGWGNNELKEARERDILEKTMLDFDAANHCDFCGLPLSGVSYERINDGRVRCNECATSAIDNEQEFIETFTHALGTMESFYNIDINVAVAVGMTDAKTIAKGAHAVFVPSHYFTPRVLGFAKYYRGKYSILVENGAPRLMAVKTLVHELTHIWQYINWKDEDIKKIYGNGSNRDLVYEGMAEWSAIQYLYLIGETNFAREQELICEERDDAYGIGFVLFRERYPLITTSKVIKNSPFNNFPPL